MTSSCSTSPTLVYSQAHSHRPRQQGALFPNSTLRRLSALAALAGLLFAPAAQAQTYNAGGGMFLGYAWGQSSNSQRSGSQRSGGEISRAQTSGVHWGIELFGHQVTPSTEMNCGFPTTRKPRTAVGPLLQFAVNFGAPRLTLAVHGARELSFEGLGLGGEVGGSYRFGRNAGWGIHTGIVPNLGVFNGAVRAQWLLDEYSLAAGVRGPRIFDAVTNTVCVVPGRPLRTDVGPVDVAESCRRLGDADACGPTHAPPELAAAWERDAQYECASIPAFLELAETLLLQGAPQDLIERALDAACDEILHALLCSDLAERCGGVALQPTLPSVFPRSPAPGLQALMRLATESWTDGCLGEGQAARVARLGALAAQDKAAHLVQSIIARDEQKHADLAWDVLEWAVRSGGEPVRAAVAAQRHVTPTLPTPAAAPRGLEAWGRIDARQMQNVFEEHVVTSQRRLDGLLDV
jgi:hypothetical protein